MAPAPVTPRVRPPLDPDFQPIALARRAMLEAARTDGRAVPVALALEQPGGAVDVRETLVIPAGRRGAALSRVLCERLAKAMLWSRGGSRLWVDGPADLVAGLRRHYAMTSVGRFDAATIGEAVYAVPLEVVAAPRAEFPTNRDAGSVLGGHLDGCRIGFDLGASDRKAAAVLDGRVVFSEEVAWDPARQADPQWHVDQIQDSLRRAAAHLPRVDAIGGSSAGIYVDSAVRVASLFRSVPPELFRSRVAGIFRELRVAWGGIPFVVINDGEVTALAGAMLAGVGGLLGIAMGSSEAAGYVRSDGRLTPWLNELAFVPIDVGAGAAIDDWSGDRGCGGQYLSQQATGRLLGPAGIEVADAMPLPERLIQLQQLMASGDERAARVYQTVGTYLGYALIEYHELYDFDHLLLLGRVTTGGGGQLIEERAIEVLRAEAPAIAAALTFHRVSERDKRHGQAVAAASLPSLAG
ncbi:MAG: ROK family protein [Chloroflexi bacterium]|nr:ROK family protein [Chloroflexota bacterium]